MSSLKERNTLISLLMSTAGMYSQLDKNVELYVVQVVRSRECNEDPCLGVLLCPGKEAEVFLTHEN